MGTPRCFHSASQVPTPHPTSRTDCRSPTSSRTIGRAIAADRREPSTCSVKKSSVYTVMKCTLLKPRRSTGAGEGDRDPPSPAEFGEAGVVDAEVVGHLVHDGDAHLP